MRCRPPRIIKSDEIRPGLEIGVCRGAKTFRSPRQRLQQQMPRGDKIAPLWRLEFLDCDSRIPLPTNFFTGD